jgi:hypothetical protein
MPEIRNMGNLGARSGETLKPLTLFVPTFTTAWPAACIPHRSYLFGGIDGQKALDAPYEYHGNRRAQRRTAGICRLVTGRLGTTYVRAFLRLEPKAVLDEP